LASAWAKYNGWLQCYPLRTKMCTGLSIYAFGDSTMQRLEHRWSVDPKQGFRWDHWRTARMCVYGGLWLSPFLNVWYRVLDGIFVRCSPGIATSAGKLLLDQSFAAPANMTMFYTINGLLDHGSLTQVGETLESRLYPSMKRLWAVWIPVQAVNLTLVPYHLRVLVVNCVGVGWSLYLSWFGNRREET